MDTSNFINLLLLILAISREVFCRDKLFCPRLCDCQMFENYRKADCSQRKLANAYTDVPDMVEILDLSRNDISELQDNTFQNFSRVIILSLIHNKISVVTLNAFTPLLKLRQLDLSYNFLDSFDYRILENNHELLTLDLSGNNFMNLANRPIIQSKSLEILILKETKLSNIHQLLFSELPKLKKLDISHNILVACENKSVFSRLKNLEEINLKENNWKCDEKYYSLIKWFKDKNVQLKKNRCLKKKNISEQMLNDVTEKLSEDIDIETVWNTTEIEESTNKQSNTKKETPYDGLLSTNCGESEFDACPLFDVCKTNLTHLYEDYVLKLSQIEIFKVNHRNGMITMCYVGIFFGALGGGIIMYLICCLKDRKVSRMIEKTNEKQRLRKAIKERSQNAHERSSTAAPSASADQRVTNTLAASPSIIYPTRVPSFRNGVNQNLQPRSLISMSSPRQYNRRKGDEVPNILKYFRRDPRMHTDKRESNAKPEQTYFLPVTPASPTPSHVRRPISNAVSNNSVVYSEINEESNIPVTYCCAQHTATARQTSYTPPPSYQQVMIKTSDPSQPPIKRQLSLN